ncbi:MAG: DUF2341 domain-containing protein [Thermoplasmatales archaeon]|nr:DUF2341 domain-containing protein [Thermoplasmatales archaeon]
METGCEEIGSACYQPQSSSYYAKRSSSYVKNIDYLVDRVIAKNSKVSFTQSRVKNDSFKSIKKLWKHRVNKKPSMIFNKKLIAVALVFSLLSLGLIPIITSSDNNNGEPADITIINVYSYPTVGGKWTVMFTTVGKADLTITAVNGTSWTNNDSGGYDLQFLEIKSGNETLKYSWVNGSVVVENYSSNETGYEISRVLTSGRHTLKFQFGDDVEYAYNDAFVWWNTSWSSRKLITVNSSQVDSDLTNFPILISITDTDLRDDAQDDGDDIAFILWSDNSTKLNHEIELFNGTSGNLVAWVNVTSLSSSSDTKIWMYYNNSACSSQENVDGTWDSNYVGVYHLNESLGNRNDSTSNNHHGTLIGTPDRVAGVMAGGLYTSGVGEALNLTGTSDYDFRTDTGIDWTITMWASTTDTTGYFLNRADYGHTVRQLGWADFSGVTQLWIPPGTGTSVELHSDCIDGYGWCYISLRVVDDDAQFIWNTTAYSWVDVGVAIVSVSDGSPLIGGRHDGSGGVGYPLQGNFDEVRISNILRTQEWINTSYNTMNSPNTFINVGSKQNVTGTSVDKISPYNVTYSPYTITATAASGLNNVTLWYRYSTDNSSWGSNVSWNDASNPDTESPWQWSFNFTNGTGYYEFYSIGKLSGLPDESTPGSADAICFFNESLNTPPSIALINPSPNGTTGVSTQPMCQIWANDSDGDSLTVYWYENTTLSWVLKNTSVVSANSTVNYTFTEFSDYSTTYWWKVAVNDSMDNITVIYHFTTETINTSVDPISPYLITSSPFNITATGPSNLNNITLCYRWSEDNQSWGPATITVDNTSSTSEDAASPSISWPHTVGNSYGNRILVVCSGAEDDTSTDIVVASADYNGKALQKADAEVVTSGGYYASSEIWYILNPDTGTHNVRVNFTGDVFDSEGGAISLYNVSQQAPEVTNTSNVTASDTILTYITTLSNKSMVIDCVGAGDAVTFTQDNDQTEFYDEITGSNSGAGSYKLVSTLGSTFMRQNASASANRMAHVVASFAPAILGTNWTKWNNDSNPDTGSPWSWDFDFPNSTGYYEFYSIGNKSGSPNETAPGSADAICYFSTPTAPVINSYDLRNSTGSKLNNATGAQEVNTEYYFTVNITDSDGWDSIDYINITAWYDNGSDSTIYNQTSGGNLNMFLQYKNTTGTPEFNMIWPDDEATLVLANCKETVISSTTRIINISFKPLSQVRWANSNDTWDATPNTTNDPYSWNFNITVVDVSGMNNSIIDEYGVYRYTSVLPDSDWVDVVALPGFSDDSSVVTIIYSSNYDFNMSIYSEENLTHTLWGNTIEIANNVKILADADPNDDIVSDKVFQGIGEVNAIDIFNTSGIFSVDNISQTVDVQFNVFIPFGTLGGEYTARVATKIIQK